jgi:hypothetical protein
MYNGSIRYVQDIRNGDLLMGDDSEPRNVLSLGYGEDELYDIVPVKGEKYGVNSEHILCLKPSGLNKIKYIKNKNQTTSYRVEYLNNKTYKINSKHFNNFDDAYMYLNIKKEENDIIEIPVKTLLSLPISNGFSGLFNTIELVSILLLKFIAYVVNPCLTCLLENITRGAKL